MAVGMVVSGVAASICLFSGMEDEKIESCMKRLNIGFAGLTAVVALVWPYLTV